MYRDNPSHRIRLHPEYTAEVSGPKRHTLTHGLTIAAERFTEDAAQFRAEALKIACAFAFLPVDADTVFMWPGACVQMAEQFERQAQDTRDLLDLIQGEAHADEDEDEPVVFIARAVDQNGLA